MVEESFVVYHGDVRGMLFLVLDPPDYPGFCRVVDEWYSRVTDETTLVVKPFAYDGEFG